MNTKATWLGYTIAFLAGTIGALVFHGLYMPLPWMLGSLFGALVATNLPWLPILSPNKLASPVRMILGTAIGGAFTPALLQEIPRYLVSLSLLLPFLVIMVCLGMVYFRKTVGLDRRTAFFCSLPGGLVELTLICESYGADIRRVVLIQTTRVLMIVTTVPFAIHYWTQVDLSGRTRLAAPLADLPLDQSVILVAIALIGWLSMRSTGLPGAAIVGPMILSAVCYSLGWVTAKVPDELINGAQLILGTGIGCAFLNIRLRETLRALAVTLGYFLILMTVAIAVAIGIHLLTGIPLVAAVLAFVPGGQAEMNVIGLIVGVAVPYIALHHIFRMLLVMTIAPPLSTWLLGPRDTSTTQ